MNLLETKCPSPQYPLGGFSIADIELRPAKQFGEVVAAFFQDRITIVRLLEEKHNAERCRFPCCISADGTIANERPALITVAAAPFVE